MAPGRLSVPVTSPQDLAKWAIDIGELKAMTNPIQSVYNWYRNTIRNPKYRWWLILGTLAYVFSPLDLSPDLFPIVGQIDDVVLLTLMVSEVSQWLIDRAKVRKGETVTATTDSMADKTVDVDAVSVQ
jgi:uncharacterized membrane protein YkvA (DUF1232 family)